MQSLTDATSTVFAIFPCAKIVGKYPIYQIQGRMDLIDRADFLINPCRISPQLIQQIIDDFGQEILMNFEEKTEFEGLTPRLYVFTLQNVNEKDIFTISISTDIGTQIHLTICASTIDSSGLIETRMSNMNDRYHHNNYHDYYGTNYDDVNNRIIRITRPFNTIAYSVDRKYSYLRLINLISELFKDDIHNPWTFSSQYEYDLLNIYQYSDGMDDIIESEHVCPICRDNFSTNDMCIKLKCEHSYHTTCLVNNLSVIGPNSDTCPICRHQIFS